MWHSVCRPVAYVGFGIYAHCETYDLCAAIRPLIAAGWRCRWLIWLVKSRSFLFTRQKYYFFFNYTNFALFFFATSSLILHISLSRRYPEDTPKIAHTNPANISNRDIYFYYAVWVVWACSKTSILQSKEKVYFWRNIHWVSMYRVPRCIFEVGELVMHARSVASTIPRR